MTALIIILFIVGVIAGGFYIDSKENKDRIQRSGGMYRKYKVLIDQLKDNGNVQLEIVRQTSENLVMQYASAGGRTTIYLNQIWRKLQVKWDFHSPFYGDHELSWSFNESDEQLEMAEYIQKNLIAYELEIMNALKDHSKAMDIEPKDAGKYYRSGLDKAHEKDYRGAIADFSKAIEIDPKFAEAYKKRGDAKYFLGDSRGVVADYSKAIEIDPKDAGTYYNRGHAKQRLGDHRGAIVDCSKTIEINPKFALAYNNRGGAKYFLEDH